MISKSLQKFRIQSRLSVIIIVTGTILTVMMMVVEGEPGAFPLFLILTGSVWFFIMRFKIRAQHKESTVNSIK
jgi:predicted membrane channel-forming protein YqfA (hemolysin III family)